MTEPQDLVTEARELLAKRTVKPYLTMTLQQRMDNATFDARAPELLRQLADEVERLRRQVKQMAEDARDDAEGAANEARWQERQGEDYGSY